MRPFNKREIDNGAVKVIQMGDQTTSIKNPKVPDDVKSFTYDYSYCSFDPVAPDFADQKIVYKGQRLEKGFSKSIFDRLFCLSTRKTLLMNLS